MSRDHRPVLLRRRLRTTLTINLTLFAGAPALFGAVFVAARRWLVPHTPPAVAEAIREGRPSLVCWGLAVVAGLTLWAVLCGWAWSRAFGTPGTPRASRTLRRTRPRPMGEG